MRKDIQIYINTGDVAIESQNRVMIRPFSWVDGSGKLSRYIYGEIQIPHQITESSIRNNGIYTEIPYTPKYKEFYIRIRRVVSDDMSSFVHNPVDGTEWFLVRSGLYGREKKNTFASQLPLISDKRFYIKLNGEFADLYSGNESDFNIIDAQRQNANLLLKCIPTNSYRYPISGVGLLRWVNSNVNHTKLSETIKKEFDADGIDVESAYYDFDTKQIHLDLNQYIEE